MPQERPLPSRTLGALLYAKPKALVLEHQWAGLIRSIAARDEAALFALYRMSQAVVFALLLRMLVKRRTAEELTVEAFHDIWLYAGDYDPSQQTVLGWIMTRARSRAMDRIRAEFGGKGSNPASATGAGEPTECEQSPDRDSVMLVRQLLANRIAAEAGTETTGSGEQHWHEPEWEQVAAGIQCQLLATDSRNRRVSMLVRLAAGASYPAHVHAGREELHLLEGELWINDRKLMPGDYNVGDPGEFDERVWTETGCVGVLITSTQDELR